MNLLSNHKAWAVGLSCGAIGAGALIVACSGSSGSGGGNNNGSNPDGSTTTPSVDGGSCTNSTIPIVFSPMFSAYIPGSMAQTFQIPVVTGDGTTATWTLSDPSQGNVQAQVFTDDDGGVSFPGAMITISGSGANATSTTPGTVTVIATEASGCGAAVLNITMNTENDWTIGNTRYNNGNNLHLGGTGGGGDGGVRTRPDGGFDGGGMMGEPTTSDGGSFLETDGGTACTTCHGPTATNFIFKDVQHTPEQTGGFSDTDLQNIILTGTVPDGGYFDPSVLDGLLKQTCDDAGTTLSGNLPECATKAYSTWQSFHKWADITSDEIPGVICYLRALPPQGQTGNSDFGGGGARPDGGFGHRDGGGFNHDGGGMTGVDGSATDSGQADDAASQGD